jgi:Ca-activated chloride channel family protein
VKKLTIAVILVLILVIAGGVIFKVKGFGGDTITVVQWANSHVTRPGLLNQMADQFNKEGHRTQAGNKIEIKVYSRDSVVQADELLSRASQGVPLDRELPDPTVVTPQSVEWLIQVNQGAGRNVVDISNSRTIATALAGIVTYRDMAQALGWPGKDIGYADIIALRNDPRGWSSIPNAKAEWGRKPLLAYTDPTTSTTGRSVLFSLYAIGAGKPLEQLTQADVTDPKVVDYVKQFQSLIDHYMTGTIPLNTKIYQGPRYGQFFLMPEDNLVHLYEGSEHAFINGLDVVAPPIDRPMVMIYPKEGSMVHSNLAGIVQAPWVTSEMTEAAGKWVDFLLQDDQQRAFMGAGFRTKLPLTDPNSKISGKFGLEPAPRARLLSAEGINPQVAGAIEASWQDVKRPGIVTFVTDVSGSMSGAKLDQAKQGLTRALDGMAKNNQVGFISFSDKINDQIPVGPLSQNIYDLSNTIQALSARGGTALYDAVKAGIEMTDSAPGAENAIRAVVVLTDGQANGGTTYLDNIIQMMSRNEIGIRQFRGFEGDVTASDENGSQVAKPDVIGTGLALKTKNPVQIFFIGIGKDADMEIGRMLAQATGAEFQGATEKDLGKVLETFSKYF